MSLFQDENPLLEEVRGLDIHNLTPLEAINKLYQLQEQIKGTGRPGLPGAEDSESVQR